MLGKSLLNFGILIDCRFHHFIRQILRIRRTNAETEISCDTFLLGGVRSYKRCSDRYQFLIRNKLRHQSKPLVLMKPVNAPGSAQADITIDRLMKLCHGALFLLSMLMKNL